MHSATACVLPLPVGAAMEVSPFSRVKALSILALLIEYS